MKTAPLATVVLLVALCWEPALSVRCDCQPTWRCPQARAAGSMHTCRLRGYLRGYCCPRQGGGGGGTSGGLSRNCRPLVLCPAAIADPARFGRQACRLADGSAGVMCGTSGINPMQQAAGGLGERRDGRLPLSAMQPISGARVVSESFMTVAGGNVASAADTASRVVADQVSLSNRLGSPDKSSTVGIFNLNFRSSQREQDLGLRGLQNLLTLGAVNEQGGGDMVSLVSRFGDSSPGASISPEQPTRIPGCETEEPIFCRDSRFRTINGECNNLLRPRQGRGLTGFKRLLPNTYEDSIFAIRSQSVTGRPLPSPRLISERVVETISRELNGFTLSVMQWGQFIDHDFNHALLFQLSGGGSIECCSDDGQTLPTTPLHPQCIPISIPANDPFYSRFGQRCMSLVRSLPAPEPDCIARPATPINELTAYLDASMLYGSEQEESDGLRTFSGGLLITSDNELLPLASTPPRTRRTGRLYSGRRRRQTEPSADSCVDRASVCFRGGESRVNEQSALTVMHTVFTREHNRVARALQRGHPGWDDERLFQEARRVVIAEWQHIVYNEWLPIIVGFDYARDHGLLPLTDGFSGFYDTTVDASASNEFATAAFRFGHSLLRDIYDLINAQGNVIRSVNLTTTFFDPTVVAQNFVEHARTLVNRRPETFDNNVISSVHEQLFTANFMFGLDLISLNIQRGRDHGIPTYATVLSACNDITLTSWGDLNQLMDSRAIDQLRGLYDDPRDVDLFIGGLSERRAAGAQVGPTFQCLIGQQFFDVRFGDRFFYDIGSQPHSFTAEQLAEIRKTSWARVMCDTLGAQFGNDFIRVQPLAFVESGVGPNFVSNCNSQAIPSMNLALF